MSGTSEATSAKNAAARPPRKTLYYTFGNHMHWVDMQWLWGYDVLPGSVRDMLSLIDEAGVKGNVNFDGIGYEKMAAECPEALAALRAAVQDGRVEVVGASYGQPYGLFHGGESNIRQRVFGVRAVMRLLGVRPRAFWEEEFDFFPQLPQILRGCGYTGACLFFQWTWHTPEVPFEPHSLILWEGIDGSRLPCAPRNELNLHQWPEDFAPLFDSKLLRDLEKPAIVQWVELMPSPDWMCRSELLLPRLRELLADPRFEIKPVTLSELIAELHPVGRAMPANSRDSAMPASDIPAADATTPVRRYTMDDVWHGVSLGKNGDMLRHRSRDCEKALLHAEALSALAGLFGRPYPGWDIYPTWELEEAWRTLLSAQHHDNDECEGLCGSIGLLSYNQSSRLSRGAWSKTQKHIAGRVRAPAGATVAFNHLGWSRDVVCWRNASEPDEECVIVDVPPFGYKVCQRGHVDARAVPACQIDEQPSQFVLSRGGFRVTIDRMRGVVTQVESPEFPEGALDSSRPVGELSMTVGGKPHDFGMVHCAASDAGAVKITRGAPHVDFLGTEVIVSIHPLADAVTLSYQVGTIPRPDPRMHAGLQTTVSPHFSSLRLLHDTPYAVSGFEAERNWRRKYPTGDWMTSPQVFEDIVRPFFARSFVDMLDASDDTGRGLLYVHGGNQAFFREDSGIRHLLTMYDAWDEKYFYDSVLATAYLLPHSHLTDSERIRIATELGEGLRFATASTTGGDELPRLFGALHVEPQSVLATAFYRESMKSGENLPDWAGHRIFKASGGACTHPYVIRLVEYDGEPANVALRLPGRVAMAARTNLMGEFESELIPAPAPAPFGPPDLPWSALEFSMRPREIATVMAELELGRKQTRDLDAHRNVWATVHRT